MRSRMIGGAAVLALISLAFVPVAGADTVKLSHVKLCPNQEVVPDDGNWINGDSFRAPFDVSPVDGLLVGTSDTQTANPFRNLAQNLGAGKEEARAFRSSHHGGGDSDELELEVEHTGNRDGDVDDLHMTLVSAAFVPSAAGAGTAVLETAAQPLPTPEPASLVLLGSGLAGLGVVAGRRKRKAAAREL